MTRRRVGAPRSAGLARPATAGCDGRHRRRDGAAAHHARSPRRPASRWPRPATIPVGHGAGLARPTSSGRRAACSTSGAGRSTSRRSTSTRSWWSRAGCSCSPTASCGSPTSQRVRGHRPDRRDRRPGERGRRGSSRSWTRGPASRWSRATTPAPARPIRGEVDAPDARARCGTGPGRLRRSAPAAGGSLGRRPATGGRWPSTGLPTAFALGALGRRLGCSTACAGSAATLRGQLRRAAAPLHRQGASSGPDPSSSAPASRRVLRRIAALPRLG